MAPIELLSRLKTYVTGEPEPKLPVISSAFAIAILVLYALVYVLPFYISATTRPSPQLSRDAPSVIRGRIQSVTVSCIICSVTTFVILSANDNDTWGTPLKSLHRMGYFPVGLLEAAQILALTALLFLGPLFEAGIVEGGWRNWIRLRGLRAVVGGWIGYRNMVAGPVTEEVLFRSCAVPLLILSKTSNTTIVFLTNIIFGLAHVHHFYEFRITHPHTPIVTAIARSMFQLAYTTVFGAYATFIFMRTGSLLSVIILHSFCNWMGLPRVWGRLRSEETIIGPDLGELKRNEERGSKSTNGQLGVLWTIAYYVLLVAGAVGWYKNLWTLTESDLALAKF